MEDPRLTQLRDLVIDKTIEYLEIELSDKSISAARSVLKDLSNKGEAEGMSKLQADNIREAMGDAPFKFGN